MAGLWKSFLRASTFAPVKDEHAFPEFLRALDSPGVRMPETKPSSSSPPLYCICVVSFQQGQGSVLDFQHPPDLPSSPLLPVLALPDNSHTKQQDFTCFTIEIEGKVRYGTACFRQDPLDSTRNVLQKAVVLVATRPIYAWMKGNLEGITDKFWQLQCADTSVLVTAFDTLTRTARTAGIVPVSGEVTVLDLVKMLGEDLLVLWKLILMEARVIIFGESSGKVTSAYFSLLSLFPGQLSFHHPSSLPSLYLNSLQQYGLPLSFSHSSGYYLSPSVSMGQISSLTSSGYLIGTTNQRIAEGQCSQAHAVLDLEAREFSMRLTKDMTEAAELSKREREFVSRVVIQTMREEKQAEAIVRNELHSYLKRMLASVAYVQSLSQTYTKANLKVCLKPYKSHFLLAWTRTHNFQTWKVSHPPSLSSLSEFSPLTDSVTLLFDNGDKYQGGLIAGRRCGRGKLEKINGEVYDGEWENDLKSGFGVLKNAEGTYQGRFMNDKYEGDGSFTYKNGDKYEGSWQEGRKQGMGRFEKSTGEVYIGNFDRDVYEGGGQLTESSGLLYTGDFHCGKFHGVGQVIYPSGDVFQGLFEKGVRSGPGAVTKSDGCVISGYYEGDALQSESCEVSYPSGLLYRGPVDSELRPHGHGYLLSEGEVLSTEWANGTEVSTSNRANS